MNVEVFGFAGCPHFLPAVERVRTALQQAGVEAVIHEIEIDNTQAALRIGFLGSPTVRINGLDVEPAARSSTDYGFGCRTYVVNGQRGGLPSQKWIEAAIRETIRSEAD